jgi:hypothetical protein
MKLEDQVASLELSKRLKTLGVRQESYFWWVRHYADEDVPENYYAAPYTSPGHSISGIERGDGLLRGFSAYSVAELGEMLPAMLSINGDACLWYSSDKSTKGAWFSTYGDTDTPKFEEEALTEADARAKMLIHLLENKLMEAPR